MTIPSADYELGVRNERARIARRLHAAWKQWGTDGILALLEELDSGTISNTVDYAVMHQAHHPQGKP